LNEDFHCGFLDGPIVNAGAAFAKSFVEEKRVATVSDFLTVGFSHGAEP
jgi:hypothetical protein